MQIVQIDEQYAEQMGLIPGHWALLYLSGGYDCIATFPTRKEAERAARLVKDEDQRSADRKRSTPDGFPAELSVHRETHRRRGV